MGVRVDESRHHDAPPRIDHRIVRRDQSLNRGATAHTRDAAIFDQHGAVGDDTQIAHGAAGARTGWSSQRHQLRAIGNGGFHERGSIGIWMPRSCANSIAFWYPASAWRMMPGSRIGGEHALQPPAARLGAIGHHHHPGMLRVADADAAAVMNGNPGRARRRIEHRVEQRPIGDGVRPVAHGFGFAIGRRHRTGIQMIAPDHDRRLRAFRAVHNR